METIPTFYSKAKKNHLPTQEARGNGQSRRKGNIRGVILSTQAVNLDRVLGLTRQTLELSQ